MLYSLRSLAVLAILAPYSPVAHYWPSLSFLACSDSRPRVVHYSLRSLAVLAARAAILLVLARRRRRRCRRAAAGAYLLTAPDAPLRRSTTRTRRVAPLTRPLLTALLWSHTA